MHVLTYHEPNINYSTEDFQDTARVLIEKGQHDPMAVNSDLFSTLHLYNGPLEAVEYIVNQQNQFHIDFDQRDKDGYNFITSILRCAKLRALHLIKHFHETGQIEADRE